MKCPSCEDEIVICPYCWSPIKYERPQQLKDGRAEYFTCSECGREIRGVKPNFDKLTNRNKTEKANSEVSRE